MQGQAWRQFSCAAGGKLWRLEASDSLEAKELAGACHSDRPATIFIAALEWLIACRQAALAMIGARFFPFKIMGHKVDRLMRGKLFARVFVEVVNGLALFLHHALALRQIAGLAAKILCALALQRAKPSAGCLRRGEGYVFSGGSAGRKTRQRRKEQQGKEAHRLDLYHCDAHRQRGSCGAFPTLKTNVIPAKAGIQRHASAR